MPRLSEKRLRLPDFCAGPALVAIIFIVLLIAVVIALARQDQLIVLWLDLARAGLFLLWIGLGCAAALCLLRARLESMPTMQAATLAIGAIVAVVTTVSLITVWFGRSGALASLNVLSLFPVNPWRFMLTNALIGAILGALVLRYFYVIGEWERNLELQSQARVHALQARIRPHFLYNSMNTIAALTRSNPAQAEEAVQDLADLFRASLGERQTSISLREELEITRTYQRIEALRLGERLRIHWDVDSLPLDAQVPGLVLQPLLENAIYHGIEPRRDGGIVSVSGHIDGDMIEITVRNPVPEQGDAERNGNRMALANIRERLELLFPGRATVDARAIDTEYVVQLRFPRNDEQLLVATGVFKVLPT
jgi:two-component system sensor histidine kinase AlgZ